MTAPKSRTPAISASPLTVEHWPIDRVIPYDRNPRKNQQVAKVAASIREFGFRQPIVVDAKRTVIAGHTRLAAARSLGMATVPVHVAKGLTAAQVKAYRLADNRTAEEAEWDAGLLGLEFADLKGLDFDLGLTGFDPLEISMKVGAAEVSGASAAVDQWLCVVTCRDESQLAALYERLSGEGFTCKLVT